MALVVREHQGQEVGDLAKVPEDPASDQDVLADLHEFFRRQGPSLHRTESGTPILPMS